jgi:hypothetical protein
MLTYCPFKGDCSYYSIPAGGKKSVNAVWSYEDPFPAVEQIRGRVAFYPDRVDEIAEQPAVLKKCGRAGVRQSHAGSGLPSYFALGVGTIRST